MGNGKKRRERREEYSLVGGWVVGEQRRRLSQILFFVEIF
jgi:hypothetical protein